MLHQQFNEKEFYFKIRALARKMRRNSTPAEDYFWEKVRDRRLFGFKINRQYIIICQVSPTFKKFYIADFHCYARKLIVELDGQIHLRQQEEDMIRTEHIEAYGFKVVRLTNEQVLERWDEVELELKKWLEIGVNHYP